MARQMYTTLKELKCIYDTFQLIRKKMIEDGFHVSEIGFDVINGRFGVYSVSPYKVNYEWDLWNPEHLYMGTDADGYLGYSAIREVVKDSSREAKWLYNPTSSCWKDMTKKCGKTPSTTFLMKNILELLQKCMVSEEADILINDFKYFFTEIQGKINLYDYLENLD